MGWQYELDATIKGNQDAMDAKHGADSARRKVAIEIRDEGVRRPKVRGEASL